MTGFDRFAALVATRIGVALDPRRAEQTVERLQPILVARALPHLDALCAAIEKGDSALLSNVIDALVVRETLFFRDRAPFQALREIILPRLTKARESERRLRIWSAACATGQEPYSLAMMLDEASSSLAGWRVELLATDVSESALADARSGRYTHFEIQRGLPTPLLLRHFRRDGEMWTISDYMRAAVDFRRLNLLSDFSALERFDVIFCRNVLMYMEPARRADVLKRLCAQLAPDGYLVLGAAETVVGLSEELEPAKGCPGFLERKARRPRLVAC
ncbi:MAG: protein-glutamate O-methyltransferase CheR [Hyphomicrobiales bacterium]|nr:protein-glutamate O-methyltransferase CheR [Hyphomicrobiales bacterium]